MDLPFHSNRGRQRDYMLNFSVCGIGKGVYIGMRGWFQLLYFCLLSRETVFGVAGRQWCKEGLRGLLIVGIVRLEVYVL
jgi:hypothetical protein